MFAAFITGLLMSFIGSMMPTGPIAIIVIKRSLCRQKLGALALVSGAALAEAGYALFAYLGVHFALSSYPMQTSMLRIIGGIVLVIFAIVCIFDGHSPQPKSNGSQYTGTNFLLGFSIAGLNPTFLITWTGAVAAARGAGFISGIHAAPGFALGVIVGPVLWFWIVLKVLTRHTECMRPEVLRVVEKALPLVLLILAGAMLAQGFAPLIHH